MRLKKVYDIAKIIDKTPNIRTNFILEMLKQYNPKFLKRGKYKRAFLLKINKREYILKIGSLVEVDYMIYQKLKHSKTIKYAKVYWVTKKCLLQRKCDIVSLSKKEIKQQKQFAKEKLLYDARKDNLGKYKGKLYAFDLCFIKNHIYQPEKRISSVCQNEVLRSPVGNLIKLIILL